MRFKHFTKQLDQDTSKKEEILKAAQKVFAEVGYKEATIRSICKKAKANVCLVSYYFGGKEGLYKSLFDGVFKEHIEKILKSIEVDESVTTAEEFKSRLTEYVKNVYAQMREHSDFVTIVKREIVEGGERGNDNAHKFVKFSKQKLSDFLSFGQKKKFIRRDINPGLGGAILMTLVSEFVQRESSEHMKTFYPDIPTKELPDQILKNILTIFFDGVTQ